jgi:uncharacterized membrane protein
MMIPVLSLLTVVAALGSALVSGIFFGFSVVVMRALARMAPAGGIATMQTINLVVLNPWFFAAFFGTAAVSLVLAVGDAVQWPEPGSAYLLAGSALYLIGGIVVTVARNVPLNKELGVVQPESTAAKELWARYLSVWTAWNHVRTLASFLAAVLFILALL